MSNRTSVTQELPRAEGVVFCVGFVLESVAIIVANLLTIIIFRRDQNLKQAKFYLLINLAVADLFVGVACGPFWTFNLAFAFDLWSPPRHVPLMWRRFLPEMIELFTKYASLTTLTMVAVERMFATFFPIQYRLLGPRARYGFIGICWALASMLPLTYMATFLLVVTGETGLYTMLGLTCALLLVMCLIYLAVWLKFKSSQYKVSSRRERKLTSTLFLVTVASLATWLPSQIFFSVYMIGMIREHAWFSMYTFNRVSNATAMLLLANSLLNPIIYALRMPHFKQQMMKILCQCSRKRSDIVAMKSNECRVVAPENRLDVLPTPSPLTLSPLGASQRRQPNVSG